jgi:hypothetical protein
VRLPFVRLAAGGASQRNGDARKAAQKDPFGLEPGWDRRTGPRALNHNISHWKLLTYLLNEGRSVEPAHSPAA